MVGPPDIRHFAISTLTPYLAVNDSTGLPSVACAFATSAGTSRAPDGSVASSSSGFDVGTVARTV